MSNPVQGVNAATPQQSHPQATALPSKPATARTTAPQDKVTISDSAKQALANNTQAVPGGKER